MAEWSRASTDDGQTFVYFDEGSGPLVVLLHGFPDTPHGYERIAGALVDAGYRAVRPWLRGYHPETIVEDLPYDLVTIGSDPVRLLDALGEHDAVIAGHDWGSAMAYGAAALHPDRVRAIVPIALPHFNFLPRNLPTLIAARHMLALQLPWAERSVRRNDFAYLERLYRRWAPRWTGPDRESCLARAKEAFSDRRALSGALDHYRALRPGTPAELERPSPVRALITADPGIPHEVYERSAAIMGEDSEILWLDGTGHWPHREREDEFIAHMVDFVREAS
jgi:pimeloyl-ACP methyl ester carboxylesterase